MLAAADLYRKAQQQVNDEPYAAYLAENIKDIEVLEQMITAIRCYCREANLAHLMRKHVVEGNPIPQALIDRFEAIMQVDIANQAKGFAENRSGNTPGRGNAQAFPERSGRMGYGLLTLPITKTKTNTKI